MNALVVQDSYSQQVEKLLDTELSKSLELEQQLEDLKRKLAAAEERASQAEGAFYLLIDPFAGLQAALMNRERCNG